MKCRTRVMPTLLLAVSSLSLEAAVIDPDSALSPKVYSPNGVYGFWPTLMEHDYASYRGWFSIVMSGPDGLKVSGIWEQPVHFSQESFSALITNSGTAVMSYSSEQSPTRSLLFLWDYASGNARYLNSMYYVYPGSKLVDPYMPFHPVMVDPISIFPVLLTDTTLWANIDGYVGAWEYISVQARWDLTDPGTCWPGSSPGPCRAAVVIPEPATYILIASALGLVACCRRSFRTAR